MIKIYNQKVVIYLAKVYARYDKESRTYESLDSMLRRFKKSVEKEGILLDLKKKEYYVSKGLKKRLKHEEALKAKRIAEAKRLKNAAKKRSKD